MRKIGDKIGGFQIEQIFFASYYPILFTARGIKPNGHSTPQFDGKLFLFSSYDGGRWVFVETTPGIILDMLENEISIRAVFENGLSQVRELEYNVKRNLYMMHNEIYDDDNTMLPTAGEYLDAYDGEFDDEIMFYKALVGEE